MASLSEIINEAFNAMDFVKQQTSSREQETKKTGYQLAELYGKMQDEIEEAKAKGASEKEIKAIELKYQGKGLVLDRGRQATPSGKDFSKAGTDQVSTIKNIQTTKKNLYKLMVYMCELTGSQGSPAKIPTIKDTLDKLKKHTDTLIMYEAKVAAKTYKPVGKKLRKDLNSIDLNELDWEEKRVPFTSDATNVKTGQLKNKDGANFEKYAEIEGVDEKDAKEGKVDVSKIKSVKVTGKARPNADIYELLQPYIHEFGRIAKQGQDIYDDFLADKGKNAPSTKDETPEEKQARKSDYNNRRNLVQKIIDKPGSDEDFEKNYNNFRNSEKAKDATKGSNASQHANAMAKKAQDKLNKELGVEKEKVTNASGQSGEVPSLTKAFKGDKKKIFNAKFEALVKKGKPELIMFNIGQGIIDTTNTVIIMAEKFLTDASATTTTSGAVFSKEELKNNAYINYNGQKFYMFKSDAKSVYAKLCSAEENKGFAEKLDRKGGELKQKVKQIFANSSVMSEELGMFNY